MLDLPQFDRSHRELAVRLEAFRIDAIEPRAKEDDEADPARAGREVLATCARAGLLELFVPNGAPGPARDLSGARGDCLIIRFGGRGLRRAGAGQLPSVACGK